MSGYKWDKNLESLLRELGVHGSPVDVIKDRLEAEFNEELNIGFIGSPGAGKSTLMNKIAGEKIADAGIDPGVEVTKLKWGENDSIIFWDLPGYNGMPDEHKVDDYWETFNVGELDIIVCMFSNKLNDHDVNFFKKAIEKSQDVIFVRSKADDLFDPEISLEELKTNIEETYVKNTFGSQHNLLFVSAKDSNSLDELQNEILRRLDKDLQDKFKRNAKGYSKAFIEAKEKASLKTVLLYSTLGAGSGLMSVAGMLIDVQISILMVNQIGKNFNLSEKRLEKLEGKKKIQSKETQNMLNLLKAGANSPQAKKYLSHFIEKLGPQTVAKTSSKTIPIAGAGVGFASTFYVGKQTITSCRHIAESILIEEVEEAVVER